MTINYYESAKIRPASNVKEMKSEIERLSLFDPIVGATMNVANYNKISKEDFYIVLAYNALNCAQEYRDYALDMSKIMPGPSVFIKNTGNCGE